MAKPSKKYTVPAIVEPFPENWLPVHEAVEQLKDLIREVHPSRNGGLDGWQRIVKFVGRHDCLDGDLAKIIEHAVEMAQKTWTDVQKRDLYRDFKIYVPPYNGRRSDNEFDDDLDFDREIELAEESALPDSDEDDGGDIDIGWIDLTTRDQLLDATVFQAAEEALKLKKRRKKVPENLG
jgi:hypothetical protein